VKLGARFALRYALFGGVLFALYAFPFELLGVEHDPLEGYLRFFAQLAGGALHLVDQGVSVTGTLINGRYPLQIVRNCDAAEINILFASAVSAFPAPVSRKLLALLVGLTLLVTANVTRICSLYFVGVHHASWFKPMHEEVWPLALVAIAALLFLRVARYLSSEPAGPDEPEAHASAI
jgi:exosortase/archaeosortase family protein